MASETVIHPVYREAESARELRLQDVWVLAERDWRKTVDNPITWDLDTRGLLPLGLGGKTNQERDSSGWDISFLEVGNPSTKGSDLHLIIMFGPTCVPSPAYESVNVTVELEFKKSGGGGKSHKLELRHPDTDIFSNNGFFSRLILRHSPVIEDYKQDAFLDEFLDSSGHITLETRIKICIQTPPEEHMTPSRSKFVSDIGNILTSGLDTDFSLVCEDREFPCHRAILRARSEVFARTLCHNMQENEESRFVVHDSSPLAVEILLKHLYTGAIPPNLDQHTVEILQLAEFFQLEELREECRLSLVSNLTVENAVETLVHVDRFFHQDNTGMRDKVKEFIKVNAASVVEDEHWGKFVRTYPDMVTELFRAVIWTK